MKRHFLRVLGICLIICHVFCFGLTAHAQPAWPNDTVIQAEAGIVIDADTGAVLYGQNIHNAYPPASITKLLTALIVLENCSLNDTVEYTANALYSVEADSGNKLSLQVGDHLSVEDSLYALLLISVNQCANGLAEHTAGSISAFVDMMNEKVAELGLVESHFDNPSGLNGATQYVTAYDMAMIARAAFANEDLLKISSALRYKIGPTQLFPDGQSFSHEHRLLYTTDPASLFYCPEAVAGKTGYLIAAGNTLVTYGERDSRHVISVVLMGKPKQYFVDGKTLLQFGLDRFHNISISEYETRYGIGDEEICLNGSTYKQNELTIEDGAMITVPNAAGFDDVDVALEEELAQNAPIGAAGRLVYYYNDRKVGTAYLLTEGTLVEVGAVVANSDESGAASGGSPAGFQTPDIGISKIHFPGVSLGTVNPVAVLAIICSVAAAVFVVGGIVWVVRNKRREKAEREARRERRRQRFMEEGGEERQAEFDRLMEERWKRKR